MLKESDFEMACLRDKLHTIMLVSNSLRNPEGIDDALLLTNATPEQMRQAIESVGFSEEQAKEMLDALDFSLSEEDGSVNLQGTKASLDTCITSCFNNFVQPSQRWTMFQENSASPLSEDMIYVLSSGEEGSYSYQGPNKEDCNNPAEHPLNNLTRPSRLGQPMSRELGLPSGHDLTYKIFLKCLMNPKCRQYGREIELFLLRILGPYGDGKPPSEGEHLEYEFSGSFRLKEICSDFLSHFSEKLEKGKVFSNAFQDFPAYSVRNGLETYIMSKIHHVAFPYVIDTEKDDALQRQMELLSFLTPAHLDVNPILASEAIISMAKDELRRIKDFNTPGDKINCIVRCCARIFSCLDLAKTEGTMPGADDFFPVFIYVVLKANVPQLYSNCEYIETFRNPHDMITRSGYCFVNLRSALEFLLNVDSSQLNIDSAEFHRNVQQQEARLTRKMKHKAKGTKLDLRQNMQYDFDQSGRYKYNQHT